MPFFTGASNVIASGGAFNSIANNSARSGTVGRWRSCLTAPITLRTAPSPIGGFTALRATQQQVEEWSYHIHPEGWYYFFRQQHNASDPDDITSLLFIKARLFTLSFPRHENFPFVWESYIP